MKVQSAYIHIPFCRRRCFYCDFPVKVVGDRVKGSTSSAIADYIETLCHEIQLTPNLDGALETVFFGGGTPSLLSTAQVGQVLTALEQQFGIAADAEISMEIDPGTFDLPQLKDYGHLGINRISLGIQAFQDHLLAQAGRTHTRQEIENAVDHLHRASVKNYSFDLISGLPRQTETDWIESLEAAIALQPTHLSCYDLILEPGTAFNRQVELGRLALPPDTLAAQMFRLGQQVLTAAGFEHYEISNYGRPGFQSRHNRVYWERKGYYGFGMGAASYWRGHRFTRPRTTHTYAQWVNHDAAAFFVDCLEPLPWNPEEELLEALMLGLRLAGGLNWQDLATALGVHCLDPIWPSIQTFQAEGWLDLKTSTHDHIQVPSPIDLPPQTQICLRDPEGFLFSNTILATFFSQLGYTD